MNKDLHNIDDLFHSALGQYEEIPSAEVKKNLEAALDKKDAESFKRKLTIWKRTALFLLLLLSGFVLYETGFRKTGPRHSDEKNGSKTNSTISQKNKKIYANNNDTENIKNGDSISYRKEAFINKVSSSNKSIFGDTNIVVKPNEMKVPETNKFNNEPKYQKRLSKSYLNKKFLNSFPEDEKRHTPGTQINPDHYSNGFLKTITYLEKGNNDLNHSPRESNMDKMIEGAANSINRLQPFSDSLVKNSVTKTTKEEKRSSFKSFWMFTGFVAYERAGYRLDSDLPINITNIKHSEVHEPSFSFGILATRQIKKQWGLQTGLIYGLTNIGISPQKLYALQNPSGDISFKYTTSSGYAYIKPGLGAPPSLGDSLITTEGKHSLKFISLPVIIKYSSGKKRISFNPGVGIEANFLTSANVETEVESPSNPEMIFIRKLDGAKAFHLSVIADAELRYRLNNKISISLRPAIRVAISPTTENNVVETFPRSFGLGLGLTHRF